MMTTMRAVRLHDVLDARVETLPIPQPGPRELLVRVEACGICPTDVRKYAIGVATAIPLNPGHEWVGVVEAVGAGVTAGAPAQRVYGDTYAGYAEYAVLPGGAGRVVERRARDSRRPARRRADVRRAARRLRARRARQARVVAGDARLRRRGGPDGPADGRRRAPLAGAEVHVVEPHRSAAQLALEFGAAASAAGRPGRWPRPARARRGDPHDRRGGSRRALRRGGRAGRPGRALRRLRRPRRRRRSTSIGSTTGRSTSRRQRVDRHAAGQPAAQRYAEALGLIATARCRSSAWSPRTATSTASRTRSRTSCAHARPEDRALPGQTETHAASPTTAA